MKLQLFSDSAYEDTVGDLDYNIVASNEEWLASIRRCKYFITDSFHGTCFAIIFNKPFICIANKRRGYERFYSLLSHFGLLNCLIENVEQLSNAEFKCINYDEINSMILRDRMRAENWLRSNIFPVKRACSNYDILDLRIDSLENRIGGLLGNANETKQHLLAAESWLLNTHQRVDLLEKEKNNCIKYIEELQRANEELQESNKTLRLAIDNINNTFYHRAYKKMINFIKKCIK